MPELGLSGQRSHRHTQSQSLSPQRHARSVSHGGMSTSPSQTSIPISLEAARAYKPIAEAATSPSVSAPASLASDLKSSLSRTLSWPFREQQTGPLLLAGIRELRDIFDIDSERSAVVEGTPNPHWQLRVLEAGRDERGDDGREGSEAGKRSTVNATALGAALAASEGTRPRVGPRRGSIGICLALLATACAWGVATLLALRQGELYVQALEQPNGHG